MLGATWLRAGEVENCLLMPNADRCLFPVLPGGVHAKQEGAKNAAAIFKEYLAGNPDDLEVRWLLNLSYMLLGTYPQDVPAEILLKPEIFRSEIPDAALHGRRGTDRVRHAGRRGRHDRGRLRRRRPLDVILTSVDHCTAAALLPQQGRRHVRGLDEVGGPGDQFGAINAVQTDYNNDGRLDIFMLRGGWEFPIRNSLLRNNGDGTFTDVTKQAGLESGDFATHSAAWGDFDNDGWLDVFVAHETAARTAVPQPWRRHVRGRHREIRASRCSARSPRAWSSATTTTTGTPISTCRTSSARTCCTATTGTARSPRSASSSESRSRSSASRRWFFDYDNDGWLDIFVASYPNSVSELVKYYLHMPAAGRDDGAVPQQRQRHVHRRHQPGRPRPRRPGDGRQLRRPRQRRVPRHVSRDGHAVVRAR